MTGSQFVACLYRPRAVTEDRRVPGRISFFTEPLEGAPTTARPRGPSRPSPVPRGGHGSMPGLLSPGPRSAPCIPGWFCLLGAQGISISLPDAEGGFGISFSHRSRSTDLLAVLAMCESREQPPKVTAPEEDSESARQRVAARPSDCALGPPLSPAHPLPAAGACT